jgi:hypothetical protein
MIQRGVKLMMVFYPQAVSLYYPSLRYKLLHNLAAPLPSLSSFHRRQLIMTGFTCLWATRLGSFLYQVRRVHSTKDEIKHWFLLEFLGWSDCRLVISAHQEEWERF